MTTTDDAEALKAITYAAALRDLADAIADGQLRPPKTPLRLYMSRYGDEDPKAAFLAARGAFPDAEVQIDPDGYGYVEIAVSDVAKLLFDKKTLGTTTTVERPVEEFVIDPELLSPSAESAEAERSALSDAEDEAWLESKPEPVA